VTEPSDPRVDETQPVRRQAPDMDPGLAPDPQHEVEETPPERRGPVDDG
jgi:hypothetical protein